MVNRVAALATRLALIALIILLAVSAVPSNPDATRYQVARANAQTQSREVIVVVLNVQIDPGSSGLLSRAVSQARADSAAAVIVEMNTPGGLGSDMVSMIDDISASPVPVYTYVPNDSLAASAGSYIAMASRKIIMGPGSQIGPSTPIVVGGTELEQNHTQAAFLSLMTSLATKNGRNVSAAYQMVQYDIAYTHDQALEYHVADYSSDSLSESLQILNLTGSNLLYMSESPGEQVISFLSNPTVDGILFLLGIIAIALDFLHPTILLSIAGAVLIVLALIGAEAIQAGSAGNAFLVPLVLFAVAGALIVFEIKTGHGFMLFAGVVVGAFATILLAYQVPYSPSPFGDLQYIEIAIFVVAGALIAAYARWAGKAIRSKPITGSEAMIGKAGIVTSDLSPDGEASIDGVIWRARSSKGEQLTKGSRIVVKQVSGLTLVVEPESLPESRKDNTVS